MHCREIDCKPSNKCVNWLYRHLPHCTGQAAPQKNLSVAIDGLPIHNYWNNLPKNFILIRSKIVALSTNYKYQISKNVKKRYDHRNFEGKPTNATIHEVIGLLNTSMHSWSCMTAHKCLLSTLCPLRLHCSTGRLRRV